MIFNILGPLANPAGATMQVMGVYEAELVGGTPAENAAITLAILKGEDRGPKRQAVVMNAGAGLYVAEKASSLEEGVRRAEALIDSGRAYAKLKEFIQYSNQS